MATDSITLKMLDEAGLAVWDGATLYPGPLVEIEGRHSPRTKKRGEHRPTPLIQRARWSADFYGISMGARRIQI